jgi:predicted kinase
MMIVVICGLPGVGKTTLARGLAPLINAAVLSTDKIRKELIATPTYIWQERRLVYDVMTLIAKYCQNAGINCILDATFTTENSRKELRRKLALKCNQFSIIECICSEDVIVSRLRNRENDFSDADITIYRKMKNIYEPVRGEHIIVGTSNPSNIDIKKIAEQIMKDRL